MEPVVGRVAECLKLCPNLVRLTLELGESEYSEALFRCLTPQIASELQHFTLHTDRQTFTNLLPLLVGFLATSMGLQTLHLESQGWCHQSNAVGLGASRIRQLPSLQQVTVPNVGFLRCASGMVGHPPISHLCIPSVLDHNDFGYIEQEFAASLERLNIYGLQSPRRAQPLYFPILHSLTICPDGLYGTAPLTAIFDPKTPLELLHIEGMSEDLLQDIQNFVRLQPVSTLKRIVVTVQQDHRIFYRDWPSPASENTDRHWRSAHKRALRCWLWAKPCGIEVEQGWFDWDAMNCLASEDETINKLLKAVKVNNAWDRKGQRAKMQHRLEAMEDA